VHDPINCAAKVHTPYLDQAARGNLRLDVDLADQATLTLTLPMTGLVVDIVLVGEHLEQLQKQIASGIRAAKRAEKARAAAHEQAA
jgi:hypothetical protein